MNPKKTEDGKLIGGNAGMTPKEVYQTMMDTKSDWEKLDGRQGYHYVISFKPGEASEENNVCSTASGCYEGGFSRMDL